MITEILMPALSPTMTDGNLAKWYKNEGDKVKPGEVIAEIETDKATMEVEAVDEGILAKILVKAGANGVLVGEAIALVIEEEDDKSLLETYQIKGKESVTEEKAVLDKIIDKQEVISEKIADRSNSQRIFASPLAKRIAEQNSVDLSKISGSGPHGRIIKNDVISAKTSSIPQTSRVITSSGGAYDLEPVSNMRKVIARRLLESKQTVPHFYLNIDCNLDRLLNVREEVNLGAEKDKKISVNDFIIKASSMALQEVSEVNSSWSDEGIMKYRDVDISVAVAINGGLVTPIIRNANLKKISEISAEMKELATKAKDGKLKPEEYQGGGFSISNLGMFGIKSFSAIINPPQSSILAVGAGNKVPIVVGDQIKISTVAEFTLSCDHRVVDGAVGARFLAALKEYIENPLKMLV
jgi:pyruvate dehydrogenase E2 component (dihydrolipoamide acetyltransferase)